MAERIGSFSRNTSETNIDVTINLDGPGRADVETGIGFFDHMLTAFAVHGRFDLRVRVSGDLHIDQHHTVEDTGIVIGRAIAEALGDKKGVYRYGHAYVPMDETLSRCALDFSGRAMAVLNFEWQPAVGPQGFDYALTSEFFWALARAAAMTIHIDTLRGENNHHICEAAFKAFARAMDQATRLDPKLGDLLPSTKGAFDG